MKDKAVELGTASRMTSGTSVARTGGTASCSSSDDCAPTGDAKLLDDNPGSSAGLACPERIMRPYRLAPEVHACLTREGVVLLDVPHDAYLGLSLQQAHALAGIIHDWPYVPASEWMASPTPHALIEWLQTQRLIRAVPRNRHPSSVAQNFPMNRFNPWRRYRTVAYDFTTSSRSCGRWASRCSISRAAASSPRFATAESGSPGDTKHAAIYERLSELTAVYAQLRVIFFTRQRPLPARFRHARGIRLAVYGHYPRWVIGVHQESPFSAHSWVQQDHCILNGTAAFVGSYVPILIV